MKSEGTTGYYRVLLVHSTVGTVFKIHNEITFFFLSTCTVCTFICVATHMNVHSCENFSAISLRIARKNTMAALF